MANFTPRIPSEDEDFDAVAAPVRPRKPRTPRQPSLPPAVVTQPKTTPLPLKSVDESTPRTVPVSVTDDEPVVDRERAYEVPSQSAPETAYAQEEYQPDIEPTEEPNAHHSAPEFVEPFNKTVDTSADVMATPATTSKVAAMPSTKRTINTRLIVEALLVLTLLGLGSWSLALHNDRDNLRRQVTALNANPQATIQKQTNGLINDVSKLLTLPAGETPTIANVSDASQARQQSAFFNNAQNGDKVLMYVKAGEAVLYRPSSNKIILVAPLTFNSASAANPATTQKP